MCDSRLRLNASKAELALTPLLLLTLAASVNGPPVHPKPGVKFLPFPHPTSRSSVNPGSFTFTLHCVHRNPHLHHLSPGLRNFNGHALFHAPFTPLLSAVHLQPERSFRNRGLFSLPCSERSSSSSWLKDSTVVWLDQNKQQRVMGNKVRDKCEA